MAGASLERATLIIESHSMGIWGFVYGFLWEFMLFLHKIMCYCNA